MDPSILHNELQFSTSRSGGSGGQHVNKVETKVTLKFNIDTSEKLSDAQKALIYTRLKNYINRKNQLVLHHETTRSQHKNKIQVVKKFDAYITKVLKVQKKRKATKPSAQSKKKRVENKKRRSETKANRKKVKID